LIRLFQILALAFAVVSAPRTHAARPGQEVPRGSKKLQKRIDSLIAGFPAIQRGHIGFKFVDLTSGTVIAERNAGAFFTPASNAKLYTTATALVRLGPNYQFQTELRTRSSWIPGQSSVPDLQIIGGGDTNLSGRVLPYDVHSKPGDALAALRDLAMKIAEDGIKTIDGNVTGVSTRYPGSLYPNGWTIDDSIYEYGAPVCALTFNDNSVTVTVTPEQVGDLAGIETKPPGSPLVILNEVTTEPGNETHVHVSHELGTNEVVLSGRIGQTASPYEQAFAVPDPARWAANQLIQVLREQGVTVRGEARSRYEALSDWEPGAPVLPEPPPGGTLLASHQSPPLSQDIVVTNKVSQNLHAEMLLREVGHVLRGNGSLRAGIEERTKFLQEMGITPDGTGLALDDGSGLARQDLTTPDSTVTLLRAMWQRPERDVWLASLPVGGVDGTLEHRFKGITGAERVHAKTGSLGHVAALSGYIETRQHGWLAFSIMVNAAVGHDTEAQTFVDRLGGLFLGM
jgi:D-alanyl-D-alanine carboxypeptidase/D-alanyl-D-alanine-endopeptidase (penicillin-binding protein 4)